MSKTEDPAEATLRALLERAGVPPPIGQRRIQLGLLLGSTTPDFFYDDPAERAEGVCIYFDGMRGHIHGNAATQRRDREFREELRHGPLSLGSTSGVTPPCRNAWAPEPRGSIGGDVSLELGL